MLCDAAAAGVPLPDGAHLLAAVADLVSGSEGILARHQAEMVEALACCNLDLAPGHKALN